MKNRKRGFSLVELLIVLAVIAALIATITPVALNAIKKSKATQVGQNLKTLGAALENKAYVDGLTSGVIFTNDDLDAFRSIARDINVDNYAVFYNRDSDTGVVSAIIAYAGEVDDTELIKVLPDALQVANADALAVAVGSVDYADLQVDYPNGYNSAAFDTAAGTGPVSYYLLEFGIY